MIYDEYDYLEVISLLQDLSFGKLRNEFRNASPTAFDSVLCFRGNEILLHRDEDKNISFPTYQQVQKWASHWSAWFENSYQYIFRMQDANHFLWMGECGDCPNPDYHFEPVRTLRELDNKDQCYAAMTAWHLFTWYRNSRFCGRCGEKTVHDVKERMMRCPSCGNMIFPRISPAVIVAVTDGDRLLLTKYAGRSYTRYALVAGFTEIGETLEQTVQREVKEEVGLNVKNIRYYKSQPWGVDGNVLMGFYCDLDGDDTIYLDRDELSVAEWHFRNNLPAKDDGISLTREMIRVFEESLEPKT